VIIRRSLTPALGFIGREFFDPGSLLRGPTCALVSPVYPGSKVIIEAEDLTLVSRLDATYNYRGGMLAVHPLSKRYEK